MGGICGALAAQCKGQKGFGIGSRHQQSIYSAWDRSGKDKRRGTRRPLGESFVWWGIWDGQSDSYELRSMCKQNSVLREREREAAVGSGPMSNGEPR
eukprot:2617189-Amphidinium_carterae.1